MSNESNNNVLPLMGASSNLRVTGDRSTMDVTSAEDLGSRSTFGHSGGVEAPSMLPAMTAGDAETEHANLTAKLAAIDAQLDEQKFHPSTGTPSPKIDGRERELLQLQRASLTNALTYLQARAQEQLPRQGAAKAAADQDLAHRYDRELRIQALTDVRGPDGKPLGRVAATRMVDAEIAKYATEMLVRGSR